MVYVLKMKTKAFVIKESEKLETEILLNGASVKKNTIDYMYAYELGLETVEPEITRFNSGKFTVQERVKFTLEVPVTNIEKKLVTIEADLIRHSKSMKKTIKVSRQIIRQLLVCVDYNE